jgi:hypothetical protein
MAGATDIAAEWNVARATAENAISRGARVAIHRIFSAGLALETTLGLLDGHRGAAGKVREALGELELAIRDVRSVVFDHRQPDPPSGGPPG